ncbi:unnamed protein product, partial [Owenia fusiformis]
SQSKVSSGSKSSGDTSEYTYSHGSDTSDEDNDYNGDNDYPDRPRRCYQKEVEKQSCLEECTDPSGFGDWRVISPCSASCGGGKQRLERSCVNPTDSHDSCVVTEEKITDCNTQRCMDDACSEPENPAAIPLLSDSDTAPYFPGEKVFWECGEPDCLEVKVAVCVEDTLKFNSSITCPSGGCAIPHCDEPLPIINGTFEKQFPGPVEVGTYVEYSCNECYQIAEPIRTCIEDGITGDIRYEPKQLPICSRVSCQFIPKDPIGGTVSTYSNDCLSVATYTCTDPCSELVGAETRTCTPSGAWDPPNEPTCLRRECNPKAVEPDNGAIIGESSCGSSVTYSCDPCYRLKGTSERVCSESGWESPAPTCEVTKCETILAPANGKRYPMTGNENCGDVITFECDAGYTRKGPINTVCSVGETQGSAIWSNEPPTCEKNYCEPMPEDPSSGTAEPKTNTINTTVTYTCDACFTLSGSPQRTCIANPPEDPQWSPLLEPTCTMLSCSQMTVDNGNVQGTNDCGGLAQVTCDAGYYIYGQSTIQCTLQDDGTVEWVPNPPSCKARCQDMIPADPNVRKNVDESSPIDPDTDTYGANDRLVFRCAACFMIMADSVGVRDNDRLCLPTGEWDNPTPPQCEAITCSVLEAPSGGAISSQDITCGTTISYSCTDPCLLLSGSPERTCQQDGSWSGSEPVCISRTCDSEPNPPIPGTISTNDNVCGTEVTYSCPRCYELRPDTNSIRTCQPDGQWTPAIEPTCEIKACQPLSLHNGIVNGGRNCDATVTFECIEPYKLEGSSSATCLPDKTWSSPVPECVPQRCQKRMDPENGEIDIDRSAIPDENDTYTVGDVVFYRCDTCYAIADGELGPMSDHAICLSDGTWSELIPICQLLSCAPMSAPINGTMTPSDGNNKCNDEPLEFNCDPGFAAVGPGVTPIRCIPVEGGAAWDNTPISCEPRCSEPMPPLNGSIVSPTNANGEYAPGDKIEFACDTCFRISENAEGVRDADIVCKQNGEWDGPEPACELMQCVSPMLGEGVEVVDGSNDCGSSMRFECKQGYIKSGGDDEMMCLS